ncbi:Hypothetical predicted protein [Octopus vulgaris]|uniref:Uncharacterized protein n=1 Tax=Octopus vulgaris TaxID=6645 RepID=A0AA36B212_OCTVU|nr:Hypothetical predicted protein [Octopus vulgaris]
MAQTDTFMERMDDRRQGLWADQRELEVADGSALEDRCRTGDSDGPVGRDCPSNEASREAEPVLVAEICEAVPKKSCDLESVEVKESERPVEGVMADAVVPCLGPLASRPLSLGTRDEELARAGADVAESEVPALPLKDLDTELQVGTYEIIIQKKMNSQIGIYLLLQYAYHAKLSLAIRNSDACAYYRTPKLKNSCDICIRDKEHTYFLNVNGRGIRAKYRLFEYCYSVQDQNITEFLPQNIEIDINEKDIAEEPVGGKFKPSNISIVNDMDYS